MIKLLKNNGKSMTRSNFLKLALGAAALPSTVVGRAPSPCTGRAAPSAPQNLSQKIARAKAEVQLQLDYHLIGGCVFCSTEHPEPVPMGTRLHAPERKEPMPANALFDMMSVTKTIVATAAAQLVAEGKLDPDAPFTKYLPEHVLGPNCDITVRDLATHSGGFDNDRAYFGKKQSFVKDLMQKRPTWKRGERFHYACYNLILIGHILEHLEGKRLDAICKERIFDPLGMADTRWWPVVGPDRARTVQIMRNPSFIGTCQDGLCQRYKKPQGNAGVFSTAADMLKFVTDILHRKTFKKEVYDLLYTPTFDNATGRRSWGWDMGPKARPAGWSAASIFHSGFSGQTIAIDPGGSRSCATANPDAGFAGVVLTSRTAEHGTGIICRKRVLSILKTNSPT